MLDHLRALAVFARAADLGSFRAAAKDLALSPSVVGHHIRALERRVGAPLIYRTTRKLALTPAGARLLANARAMVEAAERGLDDVAGLTTGIRGQLRFSAPAFFALTGFVRDLGAFARANPGVDLQARFSEMRADLIDDGLDLVFRIGSRDDSVHVTRMLATLRRRVVASPSLVEAHGMPTTPRDLAALPMLHLGALAPTLTLQAARAKRPVVLPYVPRLTLDSAAAMRELAVVGVGVASLPEVMVRGDLQSGRLVEVLPDHRLPELPVYALWPANAQRASLTARFLDFMAPRIGKLFAAG